MQSQVMSATSKLFLSLAPMFGIEEATEAQTASPIGSSNNVVEVFITHILIRAETNMKPPTNFAPLLPTEQAFVMQGVYVIQMLQFQELK